MSATPIQLHSDALRRNIDTAQESAEEARYGNLRVDREHGAIRTLSTLRKAWSEIELLEAAIIKEAKT